MEEGRRASLGVLKDLEQEFGIGGMDPRRYSPLALAYMGDAVYEMVIRSLMLRRGNRSAHNLHRDSLPYVRAQGQARMLELLWPELNEAERAVAGRGKSAKMESHARSASPQDYKKATALEALIGYLYLDYRMDRVLELIRRGMEALDG